MSVAVDLKAQSSEGGVPERGGESREVRPEERGSERCTEGLRPARAN